MKKVTSTVALMFLFAVSVAMAQLPSAIIQPTVPRPNLAGSETITGTWTASSDFRITPYEEPGAPTVNLAGVAGDITIGTHYYRVTFVTDTGETQGGTVSALITVAGAGNARVSMTAIPTGPSGIRRRRVYRTKAGAGTYYLLTTINDNTTTTYTDNTADGSLGTTTVPTINTTASLTFKNAENANMLRFYSGIVTSSYSLTWPTALPGVISLLQTSTAGVLSWYPLPGGGPAPNNSQYIVVDYDGTLTNERKLAGTANQVILTDAGANSTLTLSTPQDIGTASGPTFSSLAISTIASVTTSVRTPIVYGGTTPSATLSLISTNNTGSEDAVHIKGGTNGGTIIASFFGAGTYAARMGLGTVTPPAKLGISTSGVGSQEIIDITPTAVLTTNEAHWDGLHIDGTALDPSGDDILIRGLHIDMDGVVTSGANDLISGARIDTPAANGVGYTSEVLSLYGGEIHQEFLVSNVANNAFRPYHLIIDTTALPASSYVTGMDVSLSSEAVPAGKVIALGVATNIDPVNQTTRVFTSPSQTEYAGRYVGSTYTDGIDGIEIFIAKNNEIWIGSPSLFNAFSVLMTTPATKSVSPTFWYFNASSVWVQFYPTDQTNGFQQNGIIIFNSSGFTNWSATGDPAGADGSTGYWIAIRRSGTPDPGTPTPTTIKTGVNTEYKWDSLGDLYVRNIASGEWHATTIAADHGGTGVANNAASTLTISGNFGTTFTVGATTALTLPAGPATVTTGTGTANYATYWTGANTVAGEQYLSVSRGGTGVGTFTANGVLYGNTTTGLLVTAQGAANTVLTANAGAPSFTASPTIGTSVTTPIVIGGTLTTSSLTLKATTANGGVESVISFLVGNDGGTEGFRVTNTGNLVFKTSVSSVTALATPTALSATQFTGFASTISGAAIMGYGTTNDVALMNRAGTVVLGVGPNTTAVNIPGSLSVTGHVTVEGVTSTGATGTGKFVFDGTPTIATPSFTTGFTIGGVAALGTIPRGNGTNFIASTSTFADTYAEGDLVYALTANTVSGLAHGAMGTILRSNGTIPAYTTSTFADTYTQGSLLYAGTANVVTGLAVTNTVGRFIRAGAAATYLPEWSALVLPNAATQYNLLYASATDTISGLATAASSILITDGSGVPSLSTTLPAHSVTTSLTTPTIYGSTAANGDITIEGTSSATKASSYVILQPTGGFVGIGTTAPVDKLEVAGAIHTSGVAVASKASEAFFDFVSGAARIGSKGADVSTRGEFVVSIAKSDSSGTLNPILVQNDGDVVLVQTSGNVGIGTVSPDRLLHAEASTALTNTVTYAQRLSHITSGTPANSIGLGLEFEQETSASNNEVIATIESVVTDVTATEEDAVLVFKTMIAGATAAEVFRTGSGGTTIASSSLSIGGIAYTYPGDNGDAGEQLQTDGSGALTWEAAASRREYKDVLRQRTTPVVALQTILATPIYDFKYRRDLAKGTGDYETIYTGPMAEEAPWAMHHGGSILNPTNIAGYSILAIQALYARIEALESEVTKLKKSADDKLSIQIDGFVEGVDVTQPNQILRVN